MKYWFYCIFMALTSNIGLAVEMDDENIRSIRQAEFKIESESLPLSVVLPHVWQMHEHSLGQTQGLYRLTMGAIGNDEVYAVLIPKLVMTAQISLNGVALFSPEQDTERLSRHWNTPVRVYLPRSALQPQNTLDIKLFSYPGYGMLAPVFIGPKDDIDALYEYRLFWQQTINKYLVVISLCIMAFSGMLWLHQRQHTAFLYFALAAFFGSFYNLNLFITHIPISAKLWWWWVHSCIDAWAVCMVLFSHRITGLHMPKFEQAIVSFALAASAIYYVTDLSEFPQTINAIHSVSFALILYIGLRQLWEYSHNATPESLLLAFGSLILFILACNDWYMKIFLALGLIQQNDPFSWRVHFNLAPMGEPLLAAALLWLIIKKYADIATDIDDLQKNLEHKISETTDIYRSEQAKIQALNVAKVTANERQQVYQNLYEDLADKLSAIYHTANNTKQADAAQAAIAELRDTVQSNQTSSSQPLNASLADIRAEVSGRCEQAGLTLHWESLNSISDIQASNSLNLALKRIVREALSNTIKHAHAQQLFIAINYISANATLTISIADDGTQTSPIQEGRGLANMCRRATELGGKLQWQQRPTGGTVISLELPCTA